MIRQTRPWGKKAHQTWRRKLLGRQKRMGGDNCNRKGKKTRWLAMRGKKRRVREKKKREEPRTFRPRALSKTKKKTGKQLRDGPKKVFHWDQVSYEKKKPGRLMLKKDKKSKNKREEAEKHRG